MSRAVQPFTPMQDLEARRLCAGPILAGVLTEQLAEFCQSGVSVIIGVRSRTGAPMAGHGLACRITAGNAMKILLREPANAGLLEAIADGSPVAVTFSEPKTHRSIQVKAPSARHVPVDDEDLEELSRQVAAFADELVFVNYTQRFASHYIAYRDDEIVALEVMPGGAFVQTPGPGAGEQLG